MCHVVFGLRGWRSIVAPYSLDGWQRAQDWLTTGEQLGQPLLSIEAWLFGQLYVDQSAIAFDLKVLRKIRRSRIDIALRVT